MERSPGVEQRNAREDSTGSANDSAHADPARIRAIHEEALSQQARLSGRPTPKEPSRLRRWLGST